MATDALDRETILKAVRTWPPDDQLALARAITEQVTANYNAGIGLLPAQQPTWKALAGIASNGAPPPSDKQIAQWLDEHRIGKYGR